MQLSIHRQISIVKIRELIKYLINCLLLYRLKKGKAFHVDLFVIAILNGWLSFWFNMDAWLVRNLYA